MDRMARRALPPLIEQPARPLDRIRAAQEAVSALVAQRPLRSGLRRLTCGDGDSERLAGVPGPAQRLSPDLVARRWPGGGCPSWARCLEAAGSPARRSTKRPRLADWPQPAP